MDNVELFKVIIGSHMWKMETLQSDYDCMVVYQQSTKEILSGYLYKATLKQKLEVIGGIDYDYQFMEIGHLINLLIKGNVNAIWAVTSPIISKDSEVLQKLRKITIENLSKSSYNSIHGMAISQFNDETKRPSMVGKGYRTALRTLNFGITMMEYGEIEFLPVVGDILREDVEEAFTEFDNAYENSKLPETVDETPFRDFLLKIRVGGLV